ncbi:uncharacterized protein LOC132704720 [Cylas formicarius]|uniref:uncharacterized protein LOC132704720 n=1 Tax=Cylas formicarius TaxID=197179 RepID=UPI002958BDDF|nr:uncharacterized protein LOC132704720 [Cylas formicarius]XP_060530891.1 uncharacterized protein LOC132704720 [Cylas formicarius]
MLSFNTHTADSKLLTVLSVLALAQSNFDEISESEFYEADSLAEAARDKRTIQTLLTSVGDFLGFDVQKRPSGLPLGQRVAVVSPAAGLPPAPPGIISVASPADAAQRQVLLPRPSTSEQRSSISFGVNLRRTNTNT